MNLNNPAYLNRIGVHESPPATLSALRQLHRQHLLTIPFENLDIGLGREITLDPRVLENKIITRKRGGFCYELNGLFYHLLERLGFQVKMISARVFRESGELGPEFDHMALVVSFATSRWLVDVGFGDGFLEPLDLNRVSEQKDPAGWFRISRQPDFGFVLSRRNEENRFISRYLFSLEKRTLEDFKEMCRYHQTSAESSFTKGMMCSLASENGRVTLSRNRLIETVHNNKTVTIFNSETEFPCLLKKHFQITLS